MAEAWRAGGLVRVDKVRTSTSVLASAYPWHNGGQLHGVGPVVGVDRLAGGAPFGLDPFRWVREQVAQNPNFVVSGAPANGKSALIKSVLWWMVGAAGHRMAVVDVKGEYRQLAEALGVPVLDLRAGGSTRVNPLDDVQGRVQFVQALSSLCVGRSLSIGEQAALEAAIDRLGDHPELVDLVRVLWEMPDQVCVRLAMSRDDSLEMTRDVRFGLQKLVEGSHAGMFSGQSTVDLAGSPRGFVIDVSGAGRDDLALALSMLVGTRAIDQMVNRVRRPTMVVNDEAWRLTAFSDLVRWLQYSQKIGREFAQSNWMVVHRLSEVGAQADGVAGRIAANLVADADTHITFRQGDRADADDVDERFKMPDSMRDFLTRLEPFHCLIRCRERFAVVRVVLSGRLAGICDTNRAMRDEIRETPTNVGRGLASSVL